MRGSTLDDLGRFDEAQLAFREAIELDRARGDLRSLTANLVNLTASLALGDEVEAILPYVEEGLRLARVHEDLTCLATLLSNQGVAFNRLGRGKEGLVFHHEALEIARKAGIKPLLCLCLHTTLECRLSLGWTEGIVPLFAEGLTLNYEMGDRAAFYVLLVYVARYLVRQGAEQAAFPLYQAAQVVLDRAFFSLYGYPTDDLAALRQHFSDRLPSDWEVWRVSLDSLPSMAELAELAIQALRRVETDASGSASASPAPSPPADSLRYLPDKAHA